MKSNPPGTPRKPQINLAFEAEEKALIEKVAKERGLNVTGLIRLLVRDEARRLSITLKYEKPPQE